MLTRLLLHDNIPSHNVKELFYDLKYHLVVGCRWLGEASHLSWPIEVGNFCRIKIGQGCDCFCS